MVPFRRSSFCFNPVLIVGIRHGHVVELQKSAIDIALISGSYSCHCTTLGFPGVISAVEEDVLSGMAPQSPEALLTAELGFS